MEGAEAALPWSQVGLPLASFPAMLLTVVAMIGRRICYVLLLAAMAAVHCPRASRGQPPRPPAAVGQAWFPGVWRPFKVIRAYLLVLHGHAALVVVADPELCREADINKFNSIVDRSVPVTIASSPSHYKSLLFSKKTSIFARTAGSQSADSKLFQYMLLDKDPYH